MANITINNRYNVPEFKGMKHATRLSIIKSKDAKYEDGTSKYFFSLDNQDKAVVNGKEIIGTRGAVSKSLAQDLAAGIKLKTSEVCVADTVAEGSSDHVWMLMRVGTSNEVDAL